MGRKRVLVVDDEMLVAMMLEDMLADMDYDVVGPASTLDQAFKLASTEALDGAILDLNLGHGEVSTPVAEKLRERGVPFLLATGYGAGEQTDALGHSGLLAKPFAMSDVETALKSILD